MPVTFPSMHIHFVVHESCEAIGALERWVETRNHHATYSRLHLHEPLPASVDDIDLLVVMGGPQSPDTTREACPHFDAAAECALMRSAIDAGKAVVGVCLGAQLLGTALGARHEHSPEREIGKFPITLTPEGRAHPLLAGFPAVLDSGHWHGDMPGLTPDARVLATSAGCPRQIIEYTPRAFGFQCHMEFTPQVIDMLIAASGPELRAYRDRPFVQSPEVLRQHDFTAANELLFRFLDRLLA